MAELLINNKNIRNVAVISKQFVKIVLVTEHFMDNLKELGGQVVFVGRIRRKKK